jgi:hypothetical protein
LAGQHVSQKKRSIRLLEAVRRHKWLFAHTPYLFCIKYNIFMWRGQKGKTRIYLFEKWHSLGFTALLTLTRPGYLKDRAGAMRLSIFA